MMLLLGVAEALARVGGGQDYSGGSDDTGGGGGGDGIPFELIRLLIWLCFEHPLIGIPLTIFVIWLWIQHNKGAPSRGVVRGRHRPPPPRAEADTRDIRARDPNFSELLLRDLAQLVYIRAWALRSGQDAAVPYLSPQVARGLRGGEKADEVVVGGLSVVNLREDPDRDRVSILYEANARQNGRWMLLRERWVWARQRGALTPPPEAMRLRACPSCGNQMDTTPEGACRSCDTPLTDGRLNWVVEQAVTLESRPLEPPERRRGGGVEEGTNLPTVFAPDLDRQKREFGLAHPDFDWSAFEARARETFLALQATWSDGDWQKARALETESLFHSHNLQLQRTRRAGLRNRCEDVKIARFEVVKIQRDAWYDLIVVRVRAAMLDWTEDASGAVVSGSRTEKRVFSEYWTFARAARPTASKAADLAHCPSCGAPLDKVSPGGVCGYCDTNIVGGERDWVLAGIEQDELYRG